MNAQLSPVASDRSQLFPPGNIDPKIHAWNFGATALLHQVTTASGIVPISTLITTSSATIMDQWRYRQLSAFVQSLPKPIRTISDLTLIESAFSEEQPVEKPLSYFYHALQSPASKGYPAFINNWEKDLHKDLSETQKVALYPSGASQGLSTKIPIMLAWMR